MYRQDNFSPYLDPEPIAEYFDHSTHRIGTAITFAIVVHFGFFLMLHSQFTLPILPDDPEPIKVQIISFEPEPEIVPEVELRPSVPTPALAPIPKPKPKPKAKPKPKPIPKPTPPPPKPKPLPPEPVPEPEPIIIPPPTEILISETPEPQAVIQPQPLPTPVEPIVEPEPVPVPVPPEPIPEPIIEITKPADDIKLAPIYEPPVEPTPEPIPEPVIEIFEPAPEPIPEPVIEIFEPVPEPLAEAPVIKDLPLAPTITETPVSGAITEEPLIEPIVEPPSPIVEEIIPEPIREIPPTPEPIQPPKVKPEVIEIIKPVVITTAPSILASPDAPTTKAEEQKSVPSSQAAPLDFILKQGRPKPRGGGGNQGRIPIGSPPGGTRRANPGAKGWTLAPGSYGEGTGKGYKGLILDMRCREAGRTHEDCPEYLQKYQGRNAEGYEEFGAHAPRGTSVSRPSRGITPGIFSAPNIGELGSPSTTVLDDAGFNGQYMGDRLSDGKPARRVRDLFGNSEPAPWTLQPPLEETPEEDELKLLILKPKKKSNE